MLYEQFHTYFTKALAHTCNIRFKIMLVTFFLKMYMLVVFNVFIKASRHPNYNSLTYYLDMSITVHILFTVLPTGVVVCDWIGTVQ